MTPVIVHSSILLDIVTQDPAWGRWSQAALRETADEAVVVINARVHAEASVGFDSIEALEDALPPDLHRREHLPFEAGDRVLTRDATRCRDRLPSPRADRSSLLNDTGTATLPGDLLVHRPRRVQQSPGALLHAVP